MLEQRTFKRRLLENGSDLLFKQYSQSASPLFYQDDLSAFCPRFLRSQAPGAQV
jgi:hypothetical protein